MLSNVEKYQQRLLFSNGTALAIKKVMFMTFLMAVCKKAPDGRPLILLIYAAHGGLTFTTYLGFEPLFESNAGERSDHCAHGRSILATQNYPLIK